jgi:hypothetical protein
MSLNPLARSIGSLLFGSSFFLSHGVQAQNIQGFDPKTKAIPDFSLTHFYQADLDYVGKRSHQDRSHPGAGRRFCLACDVRFANVG